LKRLLRQERATPPLEATVTIGAASARWGQYQIEALLGRGGMGEVFRAQDTKLNRPVAVKFLSDRLADPAARRRFQREAQMASSLNHPHIVTVYDVGEIDGRQFLVTEYVDGGTLADWAKSSPRSWQEVIELLTGVADALAIAHEAKILHRDIKPANYFDSRSGYAKLADFGLAKLFEDSQSEAIQTLSDPGTTTMPGVVIGTIAYVSPAQASGQVATMDSPGTGAPRWSPDGRQVVYHSVINGEAEIFIATAEGGKPKNLTSHPANDAFPSFSQDGQWIYFSSNRDTHTAQMEVWKMPRVRRNRDPNHGSCFLGTA
jgi:serine/threonine protein kinase